MFLDSLELRYGALGGAARGGENKSSNRTCPPNVNGRRRAIERVGTNWQTRPDGGASVGDDRHAMRVKSGAVSSAIWQVLDLISQWRDPYDRTPPTYPHRGSEPPLGHAGIGHSGTRAGTAL